MIKTLLLVIAIASLSACASIEKDGVAESGANVEREYTVGSMIPQKKNKRSADVKTVNSEDLISVPRGATGADPLGRK